MGTPQDMTACTFETSLELWFGPWRACWSSFSTCRFVEVPKRPGHQGKRAAVSQPYPVLGEAHRTFFPGDPCLVHQSHSHLPHSLAPFSGSCFGISWDKCDSQLSTPVPKQRWLWRSCPSGDGLVHPACLLQPCLHPARTAEQHLAWVIPFNFINWLVDEPLVCLRLLSTIVSAYRLGAAFYCTFPRIP